MKISIITASFNSAKTIKETIESVLSQDYPDVEYIVADGGSKDGTVEILRSYGDKIKWISEKDSGIYDAMNKGIRLATGEVIGIIGSDDFYPNSTIISQVVGAFKHSNADSVYGDLHYVAEENTSKIIRNWHAGKYKIQNFLYVWMPPHTAYYLRKDIYDKFGLYNTDFKSAGDYELMLRMLYKYKISTYYLPKVLMKMRVGGTGNASLKNRLRANKEDRLAWKVNGVEPYWFTMLLKPLSKLNQWFV